MSEKKKPVFQSKESKNDLYKSLYGLDPEENLLTVSFATKENPYLNEHHPVDPTEQGE